MGLMTDLEAIAVANVDGDPLTLAKAFVAKRTAKELAVAIAEIIRQMQRDITRERERSAFAAPLRAMVTKELSRVLDTAESAGGSALAAPKWEPPAEALARLRRLVGTGFSVSGHGTRVAWELATVPQHQARIAYQEQVLARFGMAIAQDIANHRAAIDLIERARVRCLADLLTDRPASVVTMPVAVPV